MANVEMPISELMGAVVDGLRALVPTFERARIGWREGETYDPFDKIAESLLDGIMGSAVENGIFLSPVLGIPRYGFTIDSYCQFSYISDAQSRTPNAFMCFESETRAFDTVLFAELDDAGKLLNTYRKKVAETEFALTPRMKNGALMPQVRSIIFLD